MAGTVCATVLRCRPDDEDGCHGSEASRCQSLDKPGELTRSERMAAPTGPAQKRDNVTHRTVMVPGTRPEMGSGQVKSLRGRRLATDIWHRVDTGLEV